MAAIHHGWLKIVNKFNTIGFSEGTREKLWRFPVLVACTIDTGELQHEGDGKE